MTVGALTMKRRVIYGESNYAAVVRKGGYFVDKTEYIAKLEAIENPVFLRPQRIGKSMFCSILRYYYDRNHAEHFVELFDQTWIGQHPTPSHNQYILLFFNFSVVGVGHNLAQVEHSFKNHCNTILNSLRIAYAPLLDNLPELAMSDAVADNLEKVLNYILTHQLPPVYVIIDEYDNFANQLITGNRDLHYRELTAANGFLKTFFKTLKAGRESGAVANIFITGVLPITIDELASAFNIATFLTLEPAFEAIWGSPRPKSITCLMRFIASTNLTQPPAVRSMRWSRATTTAITLSIQKARRSTTRPF